MAEFMRDTGSALTPQKHAYDIFKQYILTYAFNTMTGKRGSGKPIIIDDTTFKGKDAGDTGRYHFIPQYTGAGITGQNPTVRGNEKTLDEFYMDLKIDQIRQAFAYRGKMTDIRTIWNIREEHKRQLANWFRRETEMNLIKALTGYITDGVTELTGSEIDSTALVTGEGRCFRPDYANDKFSTVSVSAANSTNSAILSAIDAADTMNTEILDNLQDLAKTAGKYPIAPIHCKDGVERYMLVVHPKAAVALRQDPRWEKRVLASYTGAKALDGDPIATGAVGVWENIIVKEANYILTAEGSGKKIARNLLLGADAAVLAYGEQMTYLEDNDTYEHRFSTQASEIRGIKKLSFDGTDLNVAQVVCAI